MVGRLAGVAAVLLCLLPASAAADARWLGFNDNSVLAQDLNPSQDAQLLSQAGANSARITVDWSWVEKSQGKLDLSMYDPVYNAWITHGIRPVFIVTGSPQWAWPVGWQWLSTCVDGQPCHVPPDPLKDSDWASFVGAVAARFPLARAIEVWNEPNLQDFFATGVDPQRYTQLLKAAYSAVKAVNPAMPVLGGSLASGANEDAGAASYGIAPFLRAMYAAGARGSMDGLSIHAYPGSGGSAEAAIASVDAAQNTQTAAGDLTPLWITEVGASTTGGFTESSQATLLGKLLPDLMNRPDVEAVFVHSLVDASHMPATNPERGFGVLQDANDPKPAYCTVADAFGGVSSLLTRLRCAHAPVGARHRAHRRARRRRHAR